ncbi:hypothetical protein IX329_000762 [Fusobacterium necrophorum]|nr:hypothetical protein [Fusobacterium necrophorum]MBR8733189.1 hypothetical protein [Fusobacterium necrophorum]MBR8789267.1 hypothetical protein [Fusobacterium necrophorum]
MRCSCCEKEIQENEKFYEIEDEFYCDDCVEEQTVTFYRINGGDEPHHEDEVGCYKNINGYINAINVQMKYYQEDLDYYSKKHDEISKKRTENLKLRIQELEEQKRIVLGDDEK